MKINEWVGKFTGFFNEVGVELKKSEWPARPELISSTVVIVVSVAALAVFVGLSDYFLINALKLLMGGR